MSGASGFGLTGLVAALDWFRRLTRPHYAACGRPDFRPTGRSVLAGQRELGRIEGLDAVYGRIFFVCHIVNGWQPTHHCTLLTGRILSVAAASGQGGQGNALPDGNPAEPCFRRFHNQTSRWMICIGIPRLESVSWLACLAAFVLACRTPAVAAPEFEAITFAVEPGQLYLPLAEAAMTLHWRVQLNEVGKCVQFNGIEVPAGSLRCLTDGTELISSLALAIAGAEVALAAERHAATVSHCGRLFTMSAGPKWVEISLAKQQLQAWQGARLVLVSRISSGRRGSTPAGDYRAGPFKARMHYSTRYRNAPMPWSVQIHGHIFIHGFTSVPSYPASHGCIRLPLTGFNPAKFFFEWVDQGTPVRVTPN